MLAWPVMRITWQAGSAARTRRNTSMPSTSGMRRSTKATAAFSPSAELVKCAAASPEFSKRSPGALVTPGTPTARTLNDLAWSLAIEQGTSSTCLQAAEEAVDGALMQSPNDGHILDTKATIYYRLGRLDEAIDLERAALDQKETPAFSSRLDRFLRKREEHSGPIVVGTDSSAPLRIALESRDSRRQQTIVVELGDNFKEGLSLFAHVKDPSGIRGIFRAKFGPDHPRLCHLVPAEGQLNLPDDAIFEIALVDARGCENCSRDQLWWRLEPHDKTVDAYP